MKYVPRRVLERWKENAGQQASGATQREYVLRHGLMEKSEHVVGEMQQAGVKILAGTDTAAPFVYPGFSLHDELALLVDAGLTPLAALQAATRNAAQFMGQQAQRGTIEAGKTADLVLLDKDPLADIHNTRSIQAVVLNGKLLPRAALDAMLTKAQSLAAIPDAAASGK